MLIFPAIDLYAGQAVRLYKGDYQQMTVYSDNPVSVADDFASCGATCIHLVDLEGAKSGLTPNLETIRRIASCSTLFTQVGGGIRSMDTIAKYLDIGINRVILGTAAVTNPEFLHTAVSTYGDRIALGLDIRDGFVAIRGWTEKSQYTLQQFCDLIHPMGVRTLICTDISKDGAMRGTNLELYRQLSADCDLDIIASGGVSSLDDIQKLREMDLYGAIIGKAYYSGAIDLRKAIEVAK